VSSFRVDEGYRIFNTWMGEPSKIQVLKAVLDVIKRDNLLDNVNVTGKLLLDTLKQFQVLNNMENEKYFYFYHELTCWYLR